MLRCLLLRGVVCYQIYNLPQVTSIIVETESGSNLKVPCRGESHDMGG